MTDLLSEFQSHRANIAQASAADELLQRVRLGPKPKPEPSSGAGTAPATSPIQGDRVSDMTLSDLVTGKKQQSMPVRVAKDVGGGIVEAPLAVVKGVRDAYQNTVNLAKEVGDWVEQKANLPVLMIDSDGVRLTTNEDAKGHRLSDLAELPDLHAPNTVTGGLVKGVAQFLTGLKGASKLADAAGIAQKAGAAGYTLAALKGAVANFSAFDPHQQRLSNLIEQFPALQNPVTSFLASNPQDGDAEGRFKNALEGLGLGVLTDGLFSGVRMLKNARDAKAAIDQADSLATAGAGTDAKPELGNDAFRELGDEAAAPRAKLVAVKKAEAPAAEPASGGEVPAEVPAETPGKVFINFARIDAPEDVLRAIKEMADVHAGSIDAARRGTQSFEQTKLSANQQNAWKILSERRTGDPLNAEQSVAARQLWVSSADKLKTLATAAKDAPSEASLFAFRKMLATHYAIQKEVIAARTETARALSSWRIPVGSSAERMRDVMTALDASGGADVARELATRVSALSEAGMAHELEQVVEKTVYARSRDAVIEGWINGLLSNPTTHVANTLSNSSVLALRMSERAIASKISSVIGSENGVAAGEAAAQWFGVTQGWKDAFRYAAKAARTGETGFGMNKIETAREGSITSQAFNLSSTSTLGRGVDMLGTVARTPGRALAAEDEFFKTIGYRMEVNAQAVRQATQEVSAGKVAQDGFKERVAEIIANPPEHIRMAAVDSALYQTFTDTPGKLAQSLTNLTTHYPALKVILPFVKTPANILRFTFERTPLAPLMSKFRADIAAGGARRDTALAQTALGTGVMLTTADLALSGHITGNGPVEKGTRDAMAREGWQPYSIKVGKRWYSFNRLDPIGSLLGMSADVVDALRNAQHEAVDDPDTEKLAVATSIAIAGNLVNKTYLSGLASIFEAMSAPQQYGEATIQRMVGSVVPSGVAAANRLADPYQHEVYSMLDAIKARTPGLSSDMPVRRNLWGEPLTYESGIGKPFDAFSPVYSRNPGNAPIDAELLRLESNLTPPSKKTSFDGVTVDLGQYPKAYSRYMELAGNELKHPAWKLGAKDLLNRIVEGDHPLSSVYRMRSDGPDGGKDVFIRDIVRQYREMARKQVLKEFPGIASEVREKQAKQRELKLPVTG